MADEEEDDYDEFDEALQDALEDDVDVGQHPLHFQWLQSAGVQQ